jgi:hypothetical protein
MRVVFDGALGPRRHGERQRQELPLRFERDEAVE